MHTLAIKSLNEHVRNDKINLQNRNGRTEQKTKLTEKRTAEHIWN